MKDLQGRTAIVTGAASGMGRATSLSLARAGVAVVVADIDGAGAQAVAAEIEAAGGRAIGVFADVVTDEVFERLRDLAVERFGRIDIVMNNVGVLTRGLPQDLPVEEWRRVFETNLISVIRSNAVFLPILIGQGAGHIVNTASFAGLYTYSFDRMPYAASKAAIVQISEGLALYLRPLGIGVTCLCPGPVRTNIGRTGSRVFSQGLEMRGPGPMFQLMEADVVGDMVVEAIRDNTFFLPTDPQVIPLLAERATHWDAFLDDRIDNPHFIGGPPSMSPK